MPIEFTQADHKLESHLTLSVILVNQNKDVADRISEEQRRLCEDLTLANVPSEDVVYKYPLDRLHFSFVAFKPGKEYRTDEDLTSAKQEYEQVKQHYKASMERFFEETSIRQDLSVEVRDVYTEKPLSSVSLQAYPSQRILKLGKAFVESLPKDSINPKYPMVKGYPEDNPERFSINTVRWFRPLEEHEQTSLKPRIQRLDEQLRASPLRFVLKQFDLVVSDNFLANNSPIIETVRV